MARILMGAIVTKAVGKIGGMCFRIKNQTQILQRNPNPFKNRAINANSAMGIIRYVFTRWSYLNAGDKRQWGIIALNNPRSDRFGNSTTLSARDFFNMSNINTLLVGLPIIDPYEWEAFTPWLNCDFIRVNTTIPSIELNNYDYDTNCRLAIYRKRVNSIAVNPIASSLKLMAFINTQDYDGEFLWNTVAAAGYTWAPGQLYSVGIRCITTSGVVSPMIQFTIEVDA